MKTNNYSPPNPRIMAHSQEVQAAIDAITTVPDGVTIDDMGDHILTNVLGFCGCGEPVAVLEYIRAALEGIGPLKDKVLTKEMTWEEWGAENDKLFDSAGAKYFMWYVFDAKGLTEHGSSVPGWLTAKGEAVLHLLQNLPADED